MPIVAFSLYWYGLAGTVRKNSSEPVTVPSIGPSLSFPENAPVLGENFVIVVV
jgi:hypothetical protein